MHPLFRTGISLIALMANICEVLSIQNFRNVYSAPSMKMLRRDRSYECGGEKAVRAKRAEGGNCPPAPR